MIVLTTFDDDELIFEGFRAGAIGYLLKEASTEELVTAIQAAASGQSFLQPKIITKVVSSFARLAKQVSAFQAMANPLSEREQDVLRLVSTGATKPVLIMALSFLAQQYAFPSFRLEPITFQNGDVTLSGTLLSPKTGETPYPAAVILDGCCSNNTDRKFRC